MNPELESVLCGFADIRSSVIRGITHTQVRVSGLSHKARKPEFQADVYVNRRTQEVSIARIDNFDNLTLNAILSVLSRFQF